MKCITVDCNRQQAGGLGRGLCMKCYAAAKNAIDLGRTTWNELEEAGLVLPNSKNDPFTAALNRLKDGHDGTEATS